MYQSQLIYIECAFDHRWTRFYFILANLLNISKIIIYLYLVFCSNYQWILITYIVISDYSFVSAIIYYFSTTNLNSYFKFQSQCNKKIGETLYVFLLLWSIKILIAVCLHFFYACGMHLSIFYSNPYNINTLLQE